MSWLQQEASGVKLRAISVTFLVFKFVYAITAVLIVKSIYPDFPGEAENRIPILAAWFPFYLLLAAYSEEFVFRLPLALLVKWEWSVKGILIAASVLSVLFGLVHGGIVNIFIQGVAGFAYCLLFLKAGGMQGKVVKPLVVTTLVHFSFNGILALLVVAGGGTHF